MISHFFIDRPIFASVLSIVIMVVGLVALKALPVAQFPEITPPVVQIEADYPGANAEIVADSVARPIEVQLPGIDNLLYYDSTSTNDGHMSIKLTFEIGTDVDIAQVQTQNRVKLAEPQLPPEVVRQGISINKVSPDLLAVVALSSIDPTHDTVYLSNYAILRVLDNVKRLRGVGNAVVFGSQNYSMRLILDPIRMAQLSLTPTDIANVVREQNRDFPAGTIGREPALKGTELTIPVITQGRLTEVKEFEELIVRAMPNGSMIHLKDVARVELGAQSYTLEGRWNVPGIIGKAGFLTVSRDIGMGGEPYHGMVQLQSSEIGDDIAYYLTESEQVPSAVGLSAGLDAAGRLAVCGGFLVQALPRAGDSELEAVMANIAALPIAKRRLRSLS